MSITSITRRNSVQIPGSGMRTMAGRTLRVVDHNGTRPHLSSPDASPAATRDFLASTSV